MDTLTLFAKLANEECVTLKKSERKDIDWDALEDMLRKLGDMRGADCIMTISRPDHVDKSRRL